MHRDLDIGNTAIAQRSAEADARADALDARDDAIHRDGLALLSGFPGNPTASMLARLTDLGDVPNPSTRDLLEFVLSEFRVGNRRAAQLMRRYWATAMDWPEMLPDPADYPLPAKQPAERLRVTGSALDRIVEQLR